MVTALSIILCFGFAFLYASILYWMDRHEKEPKRLLLGAFFWGALIATFVALVVNTIFGIGIFLITAEEGIADFLTGTLSAPLVEEGIKGLAVLLIFLFARSEFDSVTDGIVYAGIVALGFAATENVLYLTSEFDISGWDGYFPLFFLRVILGGWNHAVFTAFTGIGLAISRMNKKTFIKIFAPLIGFSIAIFSHFLHNLTASYAGGEYGFGIMFSIDWLSWGLMFIILLISASSERRWIREQLIGEVKNGLLTQQQVEIACSPRKRNYAFLGAPAGQKLNTRRFYIACVEMAFKKHQRQKMGEEKQANSTIIQSYRDEIKKHQL